MMKRIVFDSMKCSVMGANGQHCPEPPKYHYAPDGDNPLNLCEKCRKNVEIGAYGKRLQMVVQCGIPHTIQPQERTP